MYCKVEYDEDTNEFHLIQKKNTIESLEEPFNSEVISYVFGVFESKGKTKKKKGNEIKSKTNSNGSAFISENINEYNSILNSIQSFNNSPFNIGLGIVYGLRKKIKVIK